MLDLFLPGEDGFVLLKNCRDCLPPVILMTTPLITPHISQMAEAFGIGFIVRVPCTASCIQSRLEAMLRPMLCPAAARKIPPRFREGL